MSFRVSNLALVGCLILVAAAAQAAPIVTMTPTPMGGNTALDFFYSASAPPAEFTNYRLEVRTTNGMKILDPNKSATSDVGGDAEDTWMNTVYSLLDLGPASYNFNTYRPTGIGSDNPPRDFIDWSVFDTGVGDTNTPDGLTQTAPWHLARVLVAGDATGTAKFQAFDSLSEGTPTIFDFNIGGGGTLDPPVIVPVNVGATTAVVINQALQATTNVTPVTWSGLTPAAGSPALAATLSPTGQFQWFTAGSARGPVGNGVLYSWTATATNADGADTDVALTLTLEIPEPATMSLFGLAMIGVVGLIRRRS